MADINLEQYQTDAGPISVDTPKIAFTPTTVKELTRALQEIKKRGLRLIARGGGQSFFGQSLGSAAIIDTRSLGTVSDIELVGDSVCVPAGVRIHDVLGYLRHSGVRLPVYTASATATIGGTVAVGGVSGRSFTRGMLADHVEAVTLATTDGIILSCDSETNSDVFAYALGTLGAAGIIVDLKIKVELLKPHRLQLVARSVPVGQVQRIVDVCSGVDQIVSFEGFLNLADRVSFVIYLSGELRSKSNDEELREILQSIRQRCQLEASSLRRNSIDDLMGFSASIGGWQLMAERTIKQNSDDAAFQTLPFSCFYPISRLSELGEQLRSVYNEFKELLSRPPYFAMVKSMRQSQFPWLRLSPDSELMIGIDLFVDFAVGDLERAVTVLEAIADLSARLSGRLYPYGYLPCNPTLTCLLPRVDDPLQRVRIKTDPMNRYEWPFGRLARAS